MPDEEISQHSDNNPAAKPKPASPDFLFNPQTLDQTFIALELLATMNATSDKAIEVIIDLNLEYPKGRDVARNWVQRWLDRRFKQSSTAETASPQVSDTSAAEPSQPECINKCRSRFSQQYIFARMTPASIRALVADLRSAPAKKGTSADGSRRSGRKSGKSPIYKIWLDHDLKHFANVSIVTVKADAARIAFNADGQDIVWAVADSGIDAKHPHFAKYKNLENLPSPLIHRDFTKDGDVSDAQLKSTACKDEFGHGTHVAGIIAGEILESDSIGGSNSNGKTKAKRADEDLRIEDAPAIAFRRERNEDDKVNTKVLPLKKISGMAPRTKLLSLKVLDEGGEGKTSYLIAAIEYIQHLNGNGRRIRVHGLNVSVGYIYNPEWFACGQSPLCVEIDRLVRSGVCVVVAAGNDGYGFVDSTNASGAAAGLGVTIADPGNAELAITVGSTHREMPHTYGVSYFSSKGPTADGRLKPDLLAPGEKIISCKSAQMTDKALSDSKLSRQTIDDTVAQARKDVAQYREDSGTSMAAPHVSGVIAAFLSTRREFIGRPDAIKEVFLSTTSDLKRTVFFQGKGLVDLMRAIQSI